MDFSGISATGRPLTWVRTPLHDREYELSKRRRKVVDGVTESGVKGTQGKTVSFTDSNPATFVRDISNRIFPKQRAKRTEVLDCSKNELNGRKSSQPKLRDKKRWKMVHFVVGGQNFQSPEWTFDGHPMTLLGNVEGRKVYYNNSRHSFEFPHILPDVFTGVLEFYRTGALIRPERVTLNYFLEQIEVFHLEADAIHVLLKNEGVRNSESADEICPASNKAGIRQRLWEAVENPRSSLAARIYSCFSLFMTVLSVTIFVIGTLPELRPYSLYGDSSLLEAFESPFFIVSTACYVFFIIELSLRFGLCPDRRKFMRVWTNWTDFISIIPFFVVIGILGATPMTGHGKAMPASVVTAIRACRLFLITRVCATNRHYRQHWIIILVQTLWNNIQTLFVLFFLMIICTIGFGGVLYAVEGARQDNPTFGSIPWGMWFAVVTLTTVGYGDIVPKRALGQILAIACGCVGLMFVGFVLESVSAEYHRLMRSNSQYRRYLAEQDERASVNRLVACRMATEHRSLMLRSQVNDEIHINVNGADFYLSLADVNLHPNSVLGHPSKRAHHYNPNTGSYFFPRNMDIFPAIHRYYRAPGTVLKRPPFITLQGFVEEIEFFHLSPQAVIDFFAYEGIRLVEEKQPKSPRLRYWHLVFEHYNYNITSRLIMICSLFCTGCFIINIVLESLPDLLTFPCATAMSVDIEDSLNGTSQNATASSMPSGNTYIETCFNEIVFFVIETLCTIWFVLELVTRFCVAPSKRQFVKRPMNWVDLIIIFPYIFTLIQFASTRSYLTQSFSFFRAMRLLRLISIVKFSRYFKRIQMIFAILHSTWTELLMLCYFMLINAVIFGTLMYLVEADSEGTFNSIPRAMYWAWITMLTIGYGDITPVTVIGRLLAGGVSIMGIVFWTLPMTLISDHFANYRRMYEGQDYIMHCLTRMYHLLDTETNRDGRKFSKSKNDSELHLDVDQPLSSEITTDSPPPQRSRTNRKSSIGHVKKSVSKLSMNMQPVSEDATEITTVEADMPRRFSHVQFFLG